MNVETYLVELAAMGISGYVRIFSRAGVLLDQGLGSANSQTGLANSSALAFDIASIAKTFTAAAVLHLHDLGRLRLDDTLARFFADVPADKQPITVEQLLTHRSGLTRYVSDSDTEPVGRAEVIARALREPLRAEPGAQEQYGEANYALLGAIVEDLAGAPFTEHIRSTLLAPLGLEHTGWYGEPLFATMARANGAIGQAAPSDPATWPLTWAALGAGAMLSTAEDLTCWLQAVHAPGLLSDKSRQLMLQPPAHKWSAGWEVHQRDVGLVVLKGGCSDHGFSGVAALLPERQSGLVLLLNAWPEGQDGIHHTIAAKLMTMVLGPQ